MTREELLQSLRTSGTPEDVLAAMAAVPRERFVPAGSGALAYEDSALPLGSGSTISQPAMVAVVLQELRLSPGLSVLEVGSGSGYLLALIHAMGCRAVGIEIDVRIAKQSVQVLPPEVQVIAADAAEVELDERFDRVVCSAALEAVPNWALEKLLPEGFVLAPIGAYGMQELERVYPDGIRERTGRLCRFVPFR